MIQKKITILQNDIEKIAREISENLHLSLIVFLRGNLGAGKTFFVQKVLKNLGFSDATSPTFPILNQYMLPQFTVYHFDLYRIKNQNELSFIGINETDGPTFIEWPEILENSGFNINPDYDITIIRD